MKKEGSFSRKQRTRHYRSMMSVTSPTVDWVEENCIIPKGILGQLAYSSRFVPLSEYHIERVSLSHHPLFIGNFYVGVL